MDFLMKEYSYYIKQMWYLHEIIPTNTTWKQTDLLFASRLHWASTRKPQFNEKQTIPTLISYFLKHTSVKKVFPFKLNILNNFKKLQHTQPPSRYTM